MLVDLTDLSSVSGDGLSELISGDAGFGEVIERDTASRLHLISAGRAGNGPVIDAPDLVALMLEALAETYDRVIVAVSAGIDRDKLAALAATVDGALVIGGHMGNGHAAEIANRLAASGDLQVGVIVGEPGDAEARRARAPGSRRLTGWPACRGLSPRHLTSARGGEPRQRRVAALQ